MKNIKAILFILLLIATSNVLTMNLRKTQKKDVFYNVDINVDGRHENYNNFEDKNWDGDFDFNQNGDVDFEGEFDNNYGEVDFDNHFEGEGEFDGNFENHYDGEVDFEISDDSDIDVDFDFEEKFKNEFKGKGNAFGRFKNHSDGELEENTNFDFNFENNSDGEIERISDIDNDFEEKVDDKFNGEFQGEGELNENNQVIVSGKGDEKLDVDFHEEEKLPLPDLDNHVEFEGDVEEKFAGNEQEFTNVDTGFSGTADASTEVKNESKNNGKAYGRGKNKGNKGKKDKH